jgi:hypothetical protein
MRGLLLIAAFAFFGYVLITKSMEKQARAEKERSEEEARMAEFRWQMELIETAQSLQPKCLLAPEVDPPKLQGKALICDATGKKVSAAQAKLPAEIQAKPGDQNVTVFLVVEEREVLCKSYFGGLGEFLGGKAKPIPGYRIDYTVAIVDFQSKKALGQWVARGEEPPDIVKKGLYDRTPVYGPRGSLLPQWVAGLFAQGSDAQKEEKSMNTSKNENMNDARQELTAVLKAGRDLLARPDNDFSWSSWSDAAGALREIDGIIAKIEAGVPVRQTAARVLFLPTGPIQDVSLSSGWGDEFIALAKRFDAAEARLNDTSASAK